jgi:hypothetical protein
VRSVRGEVVRPGQVVGGYRIERKLGAGGYGHVYLAWRDGVPCALKFIHPASIGDWGWRELYILLRHEFPHVVRLLSHFKWPEERPEYLVLVMEYVPGPTLYQWARDNNPCAREVVEKLLELSRALTGVHAKDVLHRDLKGDNVLVRETDGEVVLVDFGAGSMRDAPRATRAVLAPANLRYRSPESVAFLLRQDREPGERYPYAVTDEVYALGVILYVLATDLYPFGGSEYELLDEIVNDPPSPPNACNSRVPPALGDLCLRLLVKEPHARVPSTGALCAELEKLLEEARGEPGWEEPLCYGWTADGRTTEHVPEGVGHDPQAWVRRLLRRKPRRGRPPPPPAAVSESPVPSAGPPATPRRGGSERTWIVWVSMLSLAVVVGWGVRQVFKDPKPLVLESRVAPGPRLLVPLVPADFFLGDSWPWGLHVHEVAPPWMPPEADPSAAPPRADTPALVTRVTSRTESARMKKQTPDSQAQRQKKGTGAAGACLLLSMAAAANVACPGAQVRKEPEPRECPAGAVETMRQLGLPVGHQRGRGVFAGWMKRQPVPVKEGPFSIEEQGDWDVNGRTALPTGTQYFGQLLIGEKRVYGRITQAITPRGDTFTVCIEMVDGGEAGVEIDPDSKDVRVRTYVFLEAVDHFR